MTPQEAKKMLEAKLKCLIAETSGTNHDCNMRLCDGCPLNYEQGNMGEQKQALDMAINALEQQPCEDCISRQYLIERATSWDKHFADSERCVSLTEIQNAPSVTPKQKVGKWKIFTDINADQRYSCNICNNYIIKFREDNRKFNYCPYCGCWMKGEG